MLITSCFALALAAWALIYSLHIGIVLNKYQDSVKNWSQAVADDCNSNLSTYYGLLQDAVRKDVLEIVNEIKNQNQSDPLDAEVAEYVESSDVELGSALKN